MRRVSCIALPQLRVEIASQGQAPGPGKSARNAPVAIVLARPDGAVQTEYDILGNTRIDVVSREAHALGVRVGQTVAAARANRSELRVRVVARDAVRLALERVSDAASGFGTSVSFDLDEDVVWLEIGGCAHLQGGEGGLARALAGRVGELGHECRVSIADGPRIAAAVARYAPAASLLVPAGKGAEAMRALPSAALGLDDEKAKWLRDLGLSTCGDLQKLPRRSLGMRLGASAGDVLALLHGEDRAPLVPWRPPEVPEERVELEWGASSAEGLLFIMKTLCDRIATRLAGRAMATTRVALELGFDRGHLPEKAPHGSTLDLVLPAPIASATDLFAVVRTRIERLEVQAPVLVVTMRAFDLVPAVARTLDLLTPEPRADRALPRLVGELAADLGGLRIGTLALVDTWVPDERTRLVPFGQPAPEPRRRSTTSALEPSRIIPPVRVSFDTLQQQGGTRPVPLVRLAGVEWWRRGHHQRDYVAAWLPEPHGALAWIEVGDKNAWLRGWLD